VSAWLGTIATTALRALDLTLVLDLLRIEENDERWSELMSPVVSLLEDLLLVGDFDAATELLTLVVQEATGSGSKSHRQAATIAIDMLVAGSMLRHIVTHLATIDEPQFERLKTLCVSLGEVLVRPLAEALSVEERPRTRQRLTAILLALLMERRGRMGRQAGGALQALVPIAGILLLSVAAGGTALRDLALPAAAAGVPRSGFSGERAWMPTPELAELIREIDAATPDGRPIWVGLQRNDLVLFNDVTLYFLSDRKPGTVYYVAFPGLTNTEPMERTIACQLARSGVTLAVLGPNPEGEPWNLSSVPGSSFLDQWLAARTLARSQVGPYQLLRLTPDLHPDDRCP